VAKKKLWKRGWPGEYRWLFKPIFCEIDDQVFLGDEKLYRRQKKKTGVTYRTIDENTDNHEHFWFFDNTTFEGFQNNYTLGAAVRLVWSDILSRQFPKKTFRLFVSNEYCVWTKNNSESRDAEIVDFEIVPTIRLWTFDPEFEELYAKADRGPRYAWWYSRQDGAEQLAPFLAEEVYKIHEARSGQMCVGDVQDHLAQDSI